jgi:type III pantothenate kinase
MNLVVDIGNTRTKTGSFRGGELISSAIQDTFTLQTLAEWIRLYSIRKCILSSVKDEDFTLTEFLRNNTTYFINLSHTTPLPFKSLYRTPESLGKDRIAAVAGAYCSYPDTNVLVIDMGTAITYDLITREGEYKGGNISPGLVTRFRALHTFTSHLPLLEKQDLPDNLGTDTRSAIITGVQNGILYEINGYIDQFSSLYSDLLIILTGGDADFFIDKIKKPIFAFSNLILKGLNFILDYNTPNI